MYVSQLLNTRAYYGVTVLKNPTVCHIPLTEMILIAHSDALKYKFIDAPLIRALISSLQVPTTAINFLPMHL